MNHYAPQEKHVPRPENRSTMEFYLSRGYRMDAIGEFQRNRKEKTKKSKTLKDAIAQHHHTPNHEVQSERPAGMSFFEFVCGVKTCRFESTRLPYFC